MISRGDFFCRVDGAVNIVYVEGMGVDGTVNSNAPNQFNDIRAVVSLVNGRPNLLGAWEATTEPGNFYTLNPLPEARRKGVARIAFGQYRAWTVGRHSDHEALVQHGGKVTVYRDFNKDHEREGDKTETDFLGINQHWGYDYPTTDINRASAGCLVGRTKAGHRQFMGIVKSDQRYVVNRGYRFWTSIFPASQII